MDSDWPLLTGGCYSEVVFRTSVTSFDFLFCLQEDKVCTINITLGTNFPLPAFLPEAQAWFGKFETLGNSSNVTGYNWDPISEDFLAWETETEVTFEAIAGMPKSVVLNHCAGAQ
jgi:hypothetical protein